MNLEQILSIRRSQGGEGGDAHLGKVRQLLKPPCAPSSDKKEVEAKQLQSQPEEEEESCASQKRGNISVSESAGRHQQSGGAGEQVLCS